MYLRIIQQMHCHDQCSHAAWKFSDIMWYISNKTKPHRISTETEQNIKMQRHCLADESRRGGHTVNAMETKKGCSG